MIYILLFALMILASVLLLPIGVELDYSERGRRWAVIWMWLRIPVPESVHRWIYAAREKRRARAESEKAAKEQEKEESSRKPLYEKVHDFLDSMRSGVSAFKQAISVLQSASRHLRINVSRLDVIVASSNPAVTGISYGMMYAVRGALPPEWPVHIDADYTRTRPAISFRVAASATVIKLLPAAWRFRRQAAARKKNTASDLKDTNP